MDKRRKCNNNIGGLWYQQDGATPHTARHVLAWLEQSLGEQFISFRTAREWPPHSPNWNSLGFFLWGYLKDQVYTLLPESLDKLKTAVRRELRAISVHTYASVIRNFGEHLDLVISNKERHLEHCTIISDTMHCYMCWTIYR